MIRKNKKFIDPRYFMDEKTEVIKEWVVAPGRDSRGESIEPDPPEHFTAVNLLERVMEEIVAAYDSLRDPYDQETFERYLNENVVRLTEQWQEEREIERDFRRAPGER